MSRFKVNQDVLLKKQILDRLIKWLYTPIRNMDDPMIYALADKNEKLTGDYGYTVGLKSFRWGNKPIDPSLEQEAIAIINRIDQRENFEIPKVTAYFTAVLNTSNNPKDWMAILPEYFHGVFTFDMALLPDSTKTKAEIDQFNKRYEHIIEMINIRLSEIFINKFC